MPGTTFSPIRSGRVVIALCLVLFVVLLRLQADEAPKVSVEMKAIVASLKSNEHELDTSKLSKIGEKNSQTKSDQIKALEGDSKLEHYRMPVDPQMADGFIFDIYFDPAAKQYWVIRSGGFAGIVALFGPGKLPSSR